MENIKNFGEFVNEGMINEGKVNIKKEIKKVEDYFYDTEKQSKTEIWVKDYMDEDDSDGSYLFWWNAKNQECGVEYQHTHGSDESEDPCVTAQDFIDYVYANS